MLLGREREVSALLQELSGTRPALAVVHGRRRVGKSTLLRHAVDGLPAIYFQATRVGDADGQSLFKTQVARTLGADPLLDGLSGWEAILSYVHQAAATRVPGVVAVLDEFPYLCEASPALPSIVQKVWDAVRTTGAPLKLVLCGSQISFMEGVLSERNPLHGRQTREIRLEPMSFRDAAQFFPAWSPEDQVRAYAVFGGMPYYLALCDPAASLEANVHRLVLSDGAPLLEEPMHLLQAELHSVGRYASILKAVADGLTVRGEILNRVLHGEEKGHSITPYLDKLEGLRLLKKMHSMDVRAPERGRNTRFYLDDNFLTFYFRFVLPNLSAVQAGHGREVYRQRIAPEIDEYLAERFEDVCRDYVRLFVQERLPSAAARVGKIWAADHDIDVAGEILDGGRIAGECKWWKAPVGVSAYHGLLESSRKNAYFSGPGAIHHMLFARAGFTPDLLRAARNEERLSLVTLEDLLSPKRTPVRARRDDQRGPRRGPQRRRR
ncbi:MAG: ATP-binding protein [Planctomycetes bacterium]|nr:ATP-binding protein [Planctomycetota bacterium]